jgi:hypothetical protein
MSGKIAGRVGYPAKSAESALASKLPCHQPGFFKNIFRPAQCCNVNFSTPTAESD